MQADRGGLEHVAIVELHNGHAPERVARAVLLAAALRRVHDRQVEWLADLLEHPQNPSRAPRMLSVKDVRHRADDIRLQRCCGTLGTLVLSPDSEGVGKAAAHAVTRAPLCANTSGETRPGIRLARQACG